MGRLGRLFDTGITLLEGVIERIGDPDLVRCSRQRHLRSDSQWVAAQERIAALEAWVDDLLERNGALERKLWPGDCTCDTQFRSAEDYRDHLPCEGPT